MKRNVPRRKILTFLAGVSFLPLTSRIIGTPGAGSLWDRQQLIARLSRFVKETESAKAIGHRYLTLAPAEANFDTLMIRLYPGGNRQQRRATIVDQNAFARELRSRIREDFRTGNVAVIDGWYLSRTELRICATVALTKAHAASRLISVPCHS